MTQCLATVHCPTSPFGNCCGRLLATGAYFPTTAHNPADRVVLEIFAIPASQLDVPFWQIATQEVAIFQRRSKRGLVALGLLMGVLADRAKRLLDVKKATLLQQVKPHLQIGHHEERLIKPAGSKGTSEHHRARTANQITLFKQ